VGRKLSKNKYTGAQNADNIIDKSFTSSKVTKHIGLIMLGGLLLSSASADSNYNGKVLPNPIFNAVAENSPTMHKPVSIIKKSASKTPVVSILGHAQDATYDLGEALSFTGRSTDSEDGDISSSLMWSSSLDGALGVGASVIGDSLSMGPHVITAKSTDSDQQSSSTSISIFIDYDPYADADGDGLTNEEELELGTNPVAMDTDNDLLDDFTEILLDTNPMHDYGESLADFDNDGFNNQEEFRANSDILDPTSFPAMGPGFVKDEYEAEQKAWLKKKKRRVQYASLEDGYFAETGAFVANYNGTLVPLSGEQMLAYMNSAREFDKLEHTKGAYGYYVPEEPTEASAPEAARILYPQKGRRISSDSFTLNWSDSGAKAYRVRIGSQANSDDLLNAKISMGDTSYNVSNVVRNGMPVHVTLESIFENGSVSTDTAIFQTDYQQVSPIAEIQSPANGTVLSTTSPTFSWNDVGAESYRLWVGSSIGANDIKVVSAGALNTNKVINGLPQDGSKLFVRFFTQRQGTWTFYDYEYQAKTANETMVTKLTNIYKVGG